MAGSIKGIIVEIGGDTQPLQKALTDVNKKGRALQTELNQINKLLKLDPSNVTLLTQKQNVLNEAIANAASKLETLKQAEAQVQSQFAKGEVSEEQYRALQREIESTTLDLKRYQGQLENVGDESEKTADKTGKIGDKAEDTKGRVSGFAVAAGTALGNLAVNALQKVISGFETLGRKIIETVKGTAEYADEVNTLSAKFKVSTDTIQKWIYQADIVDTEVETIGSSYGKLVRAMDQADQGAKIQADAFAALGVSIRDDVTGQFRDTELVFNDIITALGSVEDETQADIYANALFGRSFQDLNPLIAAGGDKLQELGDKAGQLGVVLSPERLNALNQLQDLLDSLAVQFKLAAVPLVEALLPAFTSIAQVISDKLGDPKVQGGLAEFGKKLGDLAVRITDKLVDFLNSDQFDQLAESILNLATSAAGGFADFVEKILPQIIAFFQWVVDHQGEAVAALLAITAGIVALNIAMSANPIGAIIMAIMAVVAAIMWARAHWDEICQWFMGILQAVADFFINIWNSIRDFFVGIWTAITSFFQDAWNGMVNWFIEQATAYVQFWTEVWDGIKNTFTNVWTAISTFFTNIWNGIVTGFKSGVNAIIGGLNTVISGINAFVDGVNTVSGIFGIPAIPDIPMIPVWHAEGAIFTQATLLPGVDGRVHGVGEAGWEAVLPISSLSDIVLGAMKSVVGSGASKHVEVNIYPRDLSDGQIRRVINVINREWGAAV